ncbi:MAG: putative nucleic acid-binding protein [Verrucomicrobiales bacterium]
MSETSVRVVVADASPLIGLAKIGRLTLLEQLFQEILIPRGGEKELCLDSTRPGSKNLAEAMKKGWIASVQVGDLPRHLTSTVDLGEAEAIVLAKQELALLLVDETKGRVAATSEGLKIFGTGAVLILAKASGLIPTVAEPLRELSGVGYHLSIALQKEILRRAGE